MRFKSSFYLDKRFKLESNRYSIKVNLYSYKENKNSVFKIKPIIFDDGTKLEMSCESKKEFDSIWTNKDKFDNFGEKIGETIVYDRKLQIRTALKVKQDQLNEIIQDGNVFSLNDVKNAFYNYVKPVNYSSNVYLAFESYIEKLGKEGRWKSAGSIQTTLNIIRNYNNNLPFKFEDCTVEWLKQFDRKRRLTTSVSTLGVDMRNIRTVFNSVKSKLTHLKEIYPFGKATENLYTIPSGKSKNQSLSKDQIDKLLNLDTKNLYLQMARDYWVFSYINRGMNLTDIAQLKKGQKEWIRSKTKFTAKKVIKGTLVEHQILDEIIERHKGTGKYLFDIIDDHDDSKAAQKKIDNKNSSLNKQYKNLARMFGFPKEFSYQWARHCYTTNMMSSGLNIKVISESMNHTSIKTTENYIDSLKDEDNKKINDALGI